MTARNTFTLAAIAAAMAFGAAAQAQTSMPARPASGAQTGPQLDGSRADTAKQQGSGPMMDRKEPMPARKDMPASGAAPMAPAAKTGPQLDGSRADQAKASGRPAMKDRKEPTPARPSNANSGTAAPAKPGPQLDGLKTPQ